MRIHRNRTKLLLAPLIVLSLVVGGLAWFWLPMNKTQAADLSKFRAGNIISDYVMSNKNTMSESDISNFLRSKANCNDRNLAKVNGSQTGEYIYRGSYSWHVRDGHFVCLADEVFDGETSAHIIWQTAQDYSINPQALIVLLQKEQGLITDSYPNNIQYRSATGYGCPDTAACDSKYYGFKNQVRNAASLFRYVLDGKDNTYYPVGVRYVQYSPNKACGGTNVNIENRATQALYRYTPYQPNASAIAAGYGTGDGCGTYGNRNFYLYFTDWFGSTQYFIKTTGEISRQYHSFGGESVLGLPTINEQCIASSGCYQHYQNGSIYWSPDSGAHTIWGGIREKWSSLGWERGRLKYPTSNELCDLVKGGCIQAFQGGMIYWSPAKGAQESFTGDMRNDYLRNGEYAGALGYPIKGEECGLKSGGCYQAFENGDIHWSVSSGAHMTLNQIKSRWSELKFENGNLGYPTTDTYCGLSKGGCYNHFQDGSIYWSADTGAKSVWGSIREKWSSLGWERGALGYPTSNEVYSGNTVYQTFEHGRIVWTAQSGSRVEYY